MGDDYRFLQQTFQGILSCNFFYLVIWSSLQHWFTYHPKTLGKLTWFIINKINNLHKNPDAPHPKTTIYSLGIVISLALQCFIQKSPNPLLPTCLGGVPAVIAKKKKNRLFSDLIYNIVLLQIHPLLGCQFRYRKNKFLLFFFLFALGFSQIDILHFLWGKMVWTVIKTNIAQEPLHVVNWPNEKKKDSGLWGDPSLKGEGPIKQLLIFMYGGDSLRTFFSTQGGRYEGREGWEIYSIYKLHSTKNTVFYSLKPKIYGGKQKLNIIGQTNGAFINLFRILLFYCYGCQKP